MCQSCTCAGPSSVISQKNERSIILFDDVDDDDNNNNNNNNINFKAKVTPVIKGATGIYSKSFRTYQSNITGKHEIKKIPKKENSHTGHCTRTLGSTDVKVKQSRYRPGVAQKVPGS